MHTAPLLKILALSDVKKYSIIVLATVAVIVSLPLMVIFSMGGSVLSFLNGAVSIEQAEMQGFYMGSSVPGDTYAWGNCTYWAFAMRLWAKDPIPTTWGNANTWDDRAITDGYEVTHTPRVGSVMQTDAGSFGHVAYVTRVDEKTGVWEISEMNALMLNVVSQRVFTAGAASAYSFISGKIGSLENTPVNP